MSKTVPPDEGSLSISVPVLGLLSPGFSGPWYGRFFCDQNQKCFNQIPKNFPFSSLYFVISLFWLNYFLSFIAKNGNIVITLSQMEELMKFTRAAHLNPPLWLPAPPLRTCLGPGNQLEALRASQEAASGWHCFKWCFFVTSSVLLFSS